jgi:hypothetical protein
MYVFDMNNPVSLHGREFVHLMPGRATIIDNGNVRVSTFPMGCDITLVVAKPEGTDHCGNLSRTFHGFFGATMEEAIHKLNDHIG